MEEPAPLPWALRHIWEWFHELAGRAGSNGFGPNPLSYTEIAAWARLTGRHPQPHEVQLLLRLHDAWRVAITPKPKVEVVRGSSH